MAALSFAIENKFDTHSSEQKKRETWTFLYSSWIEREHKDKQQQDIGKW